MKFDPRITSDTTQQRDVEKKTIVRSDMYPKKEQQEHSPNETARKHNDFSLY